MPDGIDNIPGNTSGLASDQAFWLATPLAEMSDAQWESLCDGCGRCCLIKLEDEQTGQVHFTNVSCRFLDQEQCRCKDYERRSKAVPNCLILRPLTPEKCAMLPESCAYRRLSHDLPLLDWHPLISGNRNSVHDAGISVQGRVLSEEYIHPEQLEDHIIAFEPE